MTLSDSCHCEEKGTVAVIARSGASRSDVAIQYYPNQYYPNQYSLN